MNQLRAPPLRGDKEVIQENCDPNTSASATRAIQVDNQQAFTCSTNSTKGMVPRQTPHNARVSANMSSEVPVVVRIMKVAAINLQHSDAIQNRLSVAPPRSRSHQKS